ncbi:hypothetical protein V1460_18600 [Streptomyces sp. SCSIO 30461]|uniref:hypothetical protein n=1 Tax=Streptomyces sp. SCSIO 30461 TaxID=3118085 RepID=UPI0030D61BF6
MTERKDRYRAALERGGDSTARPPKGTTLHSKYVSVTIDVDPDLREGLMRWVGPPVSLLVLAGATLLRAVSGATARLPLVSGGARRT